MSTTPGISYKRPWPASVPGGVVSIRGHAAAAYARTVMVRLNIDRLRREWPTSSGRSVWTGDEMVVANAWAAGNGERGTRHTLAYDPDTDTWRELDPPPQYGTLTGGVWDGQELVFWVSEEYGVAADWSLDPKTGQWRKLPPDPFGPTYDRAYVWTGDADVGPLPPRRMPSRPTRLGR